MVALVVAATAAAAVGTVNGGTPAVSAVPVPPPPQAARPSPMAIESTTAGRDLVSACAGLTHAHQDEPQEPSGSMRLPHTGQSLRSFWAS